MLIRWANENDLPAWYTLDRGEAACLATEVSEIFQHPGCMGEQDTKCPTSPADMGAELRQNKNGVGSI
jgi:hypothetical protein